MIHPVFINDAQHDNALDLSHDGLPVGSRTKLRLSLIVDLLRNVIHTVDDLLSLGRALEIVKLHRTLGQEELFKGSNDLGKVLLVFRSSAVQSIVHGSGNEVVDHLIDVLAQILAVEHLTALIIDDIALLVHNVVVFQDTLTGLEVAAFDGLLSLLDRAGEHLVVKRCILINTEGVHHVAHTLGAKQTHYIIGQRNIEAALAGIALTACTAAQLVVYTARLVALGAEDEQASGGFDLFGFLIADCLMLL